MKHCNCERVIPLVLNWLQTNRDLWDSKPERYKILFESRLRLLSLTDETAADCLRRFHAERERAA